MCTADSILSSLTASLLGYVEDQLTNNEVSDDDEMKAEFIANGLTELQAIRALRFRELYMGFVYRQGHTPILKGSNALRFNPQSQTFELVRS